MKGVKYYDKRGQEIIIALLMINIVLEIVSLIMK